MTDALKWRQKLGVNSRFLMNTNWKKVYKFKFILDFLAPNPLPFPEEYLEKNAIIVKGVDKRGVRLSKNSHFIFN